MPTFEQETQITKSVLEEKDDDTKSLIGENSTESNTDEKEEVDKLSGIKLEVFADEQDLTQDELYNEIFDKDLKKDATEESTLDTQDEVLTEEEGQSK